MGVLRAIRIRKDVVGVGTAVHQWDSADVYGTSGTYDHQLVGWTGVYFLPGSIKLRGPVEYAEDADTETGGITGSP